MSERNAGVLLHISSLPSRFGIGDLGPNAYAFADFLSQCKQKIWQILPLNFVNEASGFSPYSSVSAMAGNILFISPGVLFEEGLIAKGDLKNIEMPESDSVDFAEVAKRKQGILEKAFINSRQKSPRLWKAFKKFSSEEKWLDDFAHFTVIKKKFNDASWDQWPEQLRSGNKAALKEILDEEQEEIQKLKFYQFLFFRQWKRLKTYCNKKNIIILGDLPYYVHFDSVDVWKNSSLFKLDKKFRPLAVAGTPPDAFTSEGQLWNMPVYDWKQIKKTNYDWWIKRIAQNQKLFDLIRLDHFRGFSEYWEVPAGRSAKYGSWKQGPGVPFFEIIKKKLGELRFVAEDLGDIDDKVIRLKDHFDLPGMKVLQFAFGENMARSEHIPHHHSKNFLVFTGTHDNNTTRGWWKDVDDATRSRVKIYCNKQLDEASITPELIHLAYASIAQSAIIPMQDILNLNETARMNTPGTTSNNWKWRLQSYQLTEQVAARLNQLVEIFDR